MIHCQVYESVIVGVHIANAKEIWTTVNVFDAFTSSIILAKNDLWASEFYFT